MALTFEQWMKRVDEEIIKKIGIESADLPDCDYRIWFDEGKTPTAAATKAIRNFKE